MQSALVTGATGFIGRALCRQLKNRGVHVRALARKGSEGPWEEFVACDLGSDPVPASVMEGIDTVFHAAGRVHKTSGGKRDDETAHWRVNVDGTRQVLDSAAVSGVRRFVFFSTVKASGEGGGDIVNEESDDHPASAYGRSKLEAERLVLTARESTGMTPTVLRLPLVYGPGVGGNLRRMLIAVINGRFPSIPESGGKRSMVHVEDVASAAILAACSNAAAGKRYYVTDGRDYSTRELQDLIRSAAGLSTIRWSLPSVALRTVAAVGDLVGALPGIRAPFDSEQLEKLIGSARYDSSLIQKELGFRPAHSFDSALTQMIAALNGEAGRRTLSDPGT